LAKLAGNTTTTGKYLKQTGDGANSAAPVWDEINLGTDTAGDFIATGAVSGVGLSGSASGEGSTFTVTSNATNANTASTIVARDASGDFSAGTITAAINGNAGTATAWQTARDLTLSGDVTGSATGIDGSGNISVTTTIAANSVALGTDTTGNYVSSLVAGALIDLQNNTGEGATPTVDVDLSELATSTTDADGDFFAVIDASNVQRKLTKANINLSGFNNDSGFSTTNGTVTSVSGGNGLTGTVTTSGSLAVGAGTGVTVNANDVAIGQDVATSANVQFNSIGVNTAGSGTAGQIRATSDIVSNYSDIRLKTIESPIPDALEKIKAIGGYYYTENQKAKELGYDDDKRQVGVIAQEIKAIMPEVVKPAPIDEKYLTVQYEKLVPLLIQAIKELEARVAELEA